MKERADTVKTIPTALGDDIDYRPRCLSELGFVAGRQHLKLGNRFLIKLRGRPAVNGVFVRVSINEKIVIAAPLAQHRRRGIAGGVGLPVDSDSGHELQQVKVVTPVDWQVLDLLRSDGQTRGRCVRL